MEHLRKFLIKHIITMAQTKISNTIVVQELLAFLQNKLDVMDELSLEQICTSSYKESEILEAKKVLSETATTHVRLGARTRDGRGKRDLQDIFRVFKETEPDDVPTYVARDLYKLPPVTFDHVDVTVLLKDIASLKTEVTLMKGKLQTAEQNTDELRREVALLRSINAASAIPSTPPRNVNIHRGAAVTFSPVSKNGPASCIEPQAKCNDPIPIAASDTITSPVEKSPTTSQRQKSYASVSSSRTHPGANSQLPATRVAEAVEKKKQEQSALKCKKDKDGFILVQRRKNRSSRNRNNRGTGPENEEIRAAPPTMQLYISRLDTETSGTKLLEYILKKSRNTIGNEGTKLVKLQRLESSRNTNFKSYILQIPATHKSIFLSPEFWPAGVVYRKYREARPKLPNSDKLL